MLDVDWLEKRALEAAREFNMHYERWDRGAAETYMYIISELTKEDYNSVLERIWTHAHTHARKESCNG
mgnify:CR=1 FL=1|tara:strand:+ start:220 stop:423 length:204 start_codon:yes stop_codon:yes gene_type:complete